MKFTRLVLLGSLIVFVFGYSHAQSTIDSVRYLKQWFKVYPYDQQAHTINTKGDISAQNRERDLIIPLANLPDGKYVQFLYVTDEEFKPRRKFKEASNDRIPYAVFEIRNGQLNGRAYFLNAFAGIIETGNYENNLKQGKWVDGIDTNQFKTYDKGLLNGLSRTYSKHELKKKKTLTYITHDYYSNGYLDSIYEFIVHTDWEVKTIKIPVADKTKPLATRDASTFTYKKYKDGCLIQSGMCLKRSGLVGPTSTYFPCSAQPMAVVDFGYFHQKESFRDDDYFRFWKNGLSSVLHLNQEYFALYGLETNSYGSNVYSLGAYQPLHDPFYGNILLLGATKQFHENGQQMIQYEKRDGNLYIDTLYYDNGNPRYFVVRDSVNQVYSSLYFDENGTLIKQYDQPFYQGFFLLHKGLYVPGFKEWKQDTTYSYVAIVSVDSIRNRFAPISFVNVQYKNKNLVKEIFWDPSKQQRVSYESIQGSKIPVEWFLVETYDNDFKEREVSQTTVFNKMFKVEYRYREKLLVESDYESLKNLISHDMSLADYFDAEPGYSQPAISEFGFYTKNCYHSSILEMEVLSVAYKYNDKPFNGSIKYLDKLFHDLLNIETENEKLKIKSYYSPYAVIPNHNVEFMHDRFGLQYLANGGLLVPDLLVYFPLIQSDQHFLGIQPQGRALSSYVFSRMQGQFVNGQLNGNWLLSDGQNEPLLNIQFENGIPKDSAVLYWDFWRGHNQISEVVHFKNGHPEHVRIFDHNGLLTNEFHYENQQAAWAKQYEYSQDDIYENGWNYELIKTVLSTFEDNKLVSAKETFFIDSTSVSVDYLFKDDVLEGAVQIDGDSGYVSDGYFNGFKKISGGPGKTILIRVGNNLVVQKSCLHDSGYKIWEMNFDTSHHKLSAGLNALFSHFSFARYPYKRLQVEEPGQPIEASFKRWYPNGQLHAEGNILTKRHNERTGEWMYYAPDGDLQNIINYWFYKDTVNTVFYIDSTKYLCRGVLKQFQNGKPVYEAKILDFFTRYTCTDDETHELRILYVEKDIHPDGSITLMPTREHANYYDDGILQSKGMIENGFPTGLWKFYNPDGGLTGMGQFNKGRKHGVWFFGDLTGLNFLDEFCIVPDADVSTETLSDFHRDLNIRITVYNNGNVLRTENIKGYNNSN